MPGDLARTKNSRMHNPSVEVGQANNMERFNIPVASSRRNLSSTDISDLMIFGTHLYCSPYSLGTLFEVERNDMTLETTNYENETFHSI